MKREEIKEKKRIGDMTTAAELLGITREHAGVIWMRPTSKRYPALEAALTRIIEARESVLGHKESKYTAPEIIASGASKSHKNCVQSN